MNSDNIIYIGIKLDEHSRNKLIELSEELFGDEIHQVHCDHITLAYGKEVEDFDDELIGTKVILSASHIVYDDCCAALIINKGQVEEYGVHNEHPHITLATFDDFTKPVYSNELIASSNHENEYTDDITLVGTITAVHRRRKSR